MKEWQCMRIGIILLVFLALIVVMLTPQFTGMFFKKLPSPVPVGNPSFDSPIKVAGFINRMNPVGTITDQEMLVLATKYDIVTGLDGHGYDFPGAISELRSVNPASVVYCFASSMDIIPSNDDSRTMAINLHEEAFFHSADPASLRVIRHDGLTQLWFRQDARARQAMPHYTPPGVEYYAIEYNDGSGWSTLASIDEDGVGNIPYIGLPHYTYTDTSWVSGRAYRVKSKIGAELVEYSWEEEVEFAEESIPVSLLRHDGYFFVFYLGDNPPSLENVWLLRDSDHDRMFELSEGAHPQAQTASGDYVVYYGYVAPQDRTSYVVQLTSGVRSPEGSDSYIVQNTYNNRLQNSFGSHLIKPDNPLWIAAMTQRMQDCAAQGYDGIRLDFVYDDLELQWISGAPVSERDQAYHESLPAHASAYLAALREAMPSMKILINGYFVLASYPHFGEYLAHVDGGDFEFFAYMDPYATIPREETDDAMLGILATQQMGKFSNAVVNTHPSNVEARLTGLVLYLIVMNSETYFVSEAGDGVCSEIPYFPEWDVPLGSPIIPEITSLAQIAQGNGLIYRAFANGLVYYNPTESDITVPLSGTYYKLQVSPGYSPILGGSSTATYIPLSTLTLQPKKSAILIRKVYSDAIAR